MKKKIPNERERESEREGERERERERCLTLISGTRIYISFICILFCIFIELNKLGRDSLINNHREASPL